MSRRAVAGLLVRVAAAAALIAAGLWVCITPHPRLPLRVAMGICSTSLWPGYVFCHHCAPPPLLRAQLMIGLPLYVGASYLPRLLRWLRRRDRVLFERVVIGTVIWLAGAALLVGPNFLGHRNALLAFPVFAAVAAAAWWNTSMRKRVAATFVLITAVAAWLAWRLDENFFAVHFALLATALVFLGLTEGVRLVVARVR